MNGAGNSGAGGQQQFMRTAIAMAERGMAAGGPPVGACLVRDDVIVSQAQNSVVANIDITAHAEIVAIRAACRELRSLTLSGCTLYVTVEPCAMCLAACHYAGIDAVVFGAPITAMHAHTGNELTANADWLRHAGSALRVSGGVLAAECGALVDAWSPRA